MMDSISRQKNGSVVGIWGRYLLKSAFQPIFAFVNGKLEIAAYEGLIRPFEDGRAVTPSEFFDSVKDADRFKIETLTRTLHVLNAPRKIGPQASLFINFDPSVFTDRAIADDALKDLRLVLGQAGIDPMRVVCELIEKKSGQEEALLGFVASLREHGFRIAVDDYGTADSDIQRIKNIRPDVIKFDAVWITKLMESYPGSALLAAMVDQFRGMGIKTVFEGLEDREKLDLAHRFGVDMVQGHILAMAETVHTDGPAQGAPPSPPQEAFRSERDEEAAVVLSPKQAARAFGRRTVAS